MPKLFQTTSDWFLCTFGTIFEISVLHGAHLVLPLTQPWNQPLVVGALAILFDLIRCRLCCYVIF